MRRCRKNNRTTVCCYFIDIHIEPEGNTFRVIGVIPGELLTEELTMDSDFSVYTVNMKKLLELNKNGSGSNSSTVSFGDSSKTSYELFIGGDNIKQTAKTSLQSVTWFDITKDGSVVVFDSYDKTYKIIEKNNM